jgi:hypothetical protein
MRFFLTLVVLAALCFLKPSVASAQFAQIGDLYTTPFPPTPTASASAKEKPKQVTVPEAEQEKKVVLDLLNQRATGEATFKNYLPYAVVYAVKAGVPANTITLTLLLPFLATIVVIFRYLIGLSGIGLLVPIALSITLLATGITPGFILLGAIILSSLFSRFILKRIRIMQMPKMALSMFVVSVFVVCVLSASAAYGIFDVTNLSIFPILLLLILSDRINALFMERDLQETLLTIAVTLLLGVLGFVILSLDDVRSFVLLYPETIFLLIPINVLIGRYFGLRVTEYIKFQPVIKHGSK